MGENPRVRVAAVIVKDEQILLVRHEKSGRTYWLLPGGGVDFGETLPQAITREVREETNLDIKPEKLLFVSDAIQPDRKRHIVNVYFEATITGGELQVAVDERLKEAKFIPTEKLSDLVIIPNIKQELQRYLDGRDDVCGYLDTRWEEIG